MPDKIRDWLVSKYPSQKSESPIEGLFFAATSLVLEGRLLDSIGIGLPLQQAPLGGYRVDFLFRLIDVSGGENLLVVEVDGHEFHEKTKDQVARDKARDRAILELGAITMRFAGSEVWANPFVCVEQVVRQAHALMFGCSPAKARGRAALAGMKAILEGAGHE